ncbi:4-hydroxythreonine-4-phosphate dehydrogenase PdxA [Fibrella sp. HMF5335]|uniref:4-hydroxythreonine-4-phosphate dehydrogenase PdxA n=1 Tax=Fibrella rubiginis TaxID=2817060 RepID=A0A939GM13_9BACT|nr:4-hydroxythreonine-4-phosphate dehydrogenase PdxA [Fibrella rubiginis]MBO0938853.1 4-hydroxythreonine-4-phosphate dehydrogenase PdxA [Fibrella rubiginis]
MEEQTNPTSRPGGDGPDKRAENREERPGGERTGSGRNRNRNRNRGRDRNRDRQPQAERADGGSAEATDNVDGLADALIAPAPRPPRDNAARPDRPPRDNTERGDRPPRDNAERQERPPREPRQPQGERGGQDRPPADRQRDGRNERGGQERNRDRDRQFADRQRDNRNERSAPERPVRVASPDFYIDKDDDIDPADGRPLGRVQGGSVFEQYDDEPARMTPAPLPALSEQERLVIGITLGDYNGVGPEVILKALQNNQLLRICTPIIYGSMRVLNRYRNLLNMKDWTLNGIQQASQASHKHTNVITCFSETIPVPVPVVAAKTAPAAVAEPVAATETTAPETEAVEAAEPDKPADAVAENEPVSTAAPTPTPAATPQPIDIQPGKVTPEAGAAALACLNRAVEDLKAGHLHAIVTAPINKHNIQSAAFTFPGHTEYLANAFGVPDDLMFMVSENLKIGVVTGHVPLGKVRQYITKPAIQTKLDFMFQSLKQDFGIGRPKIAVLGLNPHAGENGLIGHEEKDIITPLINEMRKKGELLYGPFPADGFFGTRSYRKYDAVLAMYHDQGLIPFKAIAFEEGVNFTAGLPIVRTSPDHGTAYDIAGKGLADETSMIQAIYTAVDVARRRKEYQELAANALKK